MECKHSFSVLEGSCRMGYSLQTLFQRCLPKASRSPEAKSENVEFKASAPSLAD